MIRHFIKHINPILLIIILISALQSCSLEHSTRGHLGNDPDLFKGTPAYTAAAAIKWNLNFLLRKEIQQNPSIVNLQGERGTTLLSFAVFNNKKKAVEILLKAGADPNLREDSITQPGFNAVLIATCDYKSPDILKMLLDYGGNPNSITNGRQGPNPDLYPKVRSSALSYASGYSLEMVKLLINYGADPNSLSQEKSEWLTYLDTASEKHLNFNIETPLGNSIVMDQMDIVLYLLEQGADYNEKFTILDSEGNPVFLDIAEYLRSCIFPLDSKEYQEKLKIIEFLKEKGIDYRNSYIHPHYIRIIKHRHPDDCEEYIKVY